VLTVEQHYELALESQSERNYAAMLVELRFAAEQGHVQAQETLGTVFLTGSTIYGPAIRADRCEAYKWFLAAARGGSEFGRINIEYLNRVRNAPRGRVACDGASA
jgi:TPR repeat protein